MSKPYMVRGKASPDWAPYDYVSDYRTRSGQRGFSTGRSSPFKSEFDLDGAIHRRSTFYSPPRLSPRSSRAFLAAKAAALGLPRSGVISDWSRDIGSPSMSRPHIATSDMDSPHTSGARRSSESGMGLPPEDAHHRDLKRKMVFDLHKEISKPIHTTYLEEISDMDRITDICFNNLRVMMENKKQRKYLHHMNNNALVAMMQPLHFMSDTLSTFHSLFDITNNSHPMSRLPMSTINAKKLVVDGNLARKASRKPAEMIQAVSPLDPLKVRGPKSILFQTSLRPEGKRRNSDASTSKGPVTKQGPAGKHDPHGHQQISMAEDPTAMFLAELEDQIESSKRETKGSSAKLSPLMTPEEILRCHYLRLNQDQVNHLEQAIRDKGADPGIHVHMNVSNYDIFSEIRRIRVGQNDKVVDNKALLEEEDETDSKSSRENFHKNVVVLESGRGASSSRKDGL